MSNDVRFALRMPQSLKSALNDAASDLRVAKAELVRETLRERIIEDDEIDVPDHLTRQLAREKAKERNELRWQRIHFPSNVADRFTRAFKQGDLGSEINPGAAEELAEIHREDAEILFDDDEREQAAKDYVAAVAEAARDAEDASDFDALDPEGMFESFGGVSAARESEDVPMRELVAEAREAIEGGASDTDALATAIANRRGVMEDRAREAIEHVLSDNDDVEGGDRDE